MQPHHSLKHAADLFSAADAIAIFAGAGMGVDSGLQQYRSSTGLWTQHLEVQNHEVRFLDLMTHDAFEEEPKRAWAFMASQKDIFQNTAPHAGFKMLLDMLQQKDYFIITSNIDEHFQKAGFDPLKIYECHGSINYMQCMDIMDRSVYPTPHLTIDYKTFEISNAIPICEKCGANCRPNIMLFEDWFWNPFRSASQQLRYIEWQKRNDGKQILAIEIGAGTTIKTIRKMSESLIKNAGSLIRVNPHEFAVPASHHLGFNMSALAWISTMNDL